MRNLSKEPRFLSSNILPCVNHRRSRIIAIDLQLSRYMWSPSRDRHSRLEVSNTAVANLDI